MKYSFLVLLFISTVFSYAQNTQYYNDSDTHFRSGLDLLDKSLYAAARKEFEQYLRGSDNTVHNADANYYLAFCALGLYHEDGEKRIEAFIKENPEHPKSVLAYYDLGNFYFKEKKYDKAANYFSKVNLVQVTEDQRQETRFKLAYSYFAQRKLEEAIEYFNVLKHSNNSYSAASNYYAGFIEYNNKEYDKAIVDLEKASKDEAYASVAPELLATLYYKQGRYDDLIAYGERVAPSSSAKSKDLNLMLGDAYLKKGKTDKGFEAYERVEKSSAGLTREEKYRIGYAYYSKKVYDKAILNLKQAASDKDSIGVYASYYLGVMYLKEGNKLYAKNAFYSARSNQINSNLREEGAYQYSKVAYDLGQSEDALEGLNYYLDNYPKGKYRNELNDIISEVYLNTSNYDLAISHIEKQSYVSKSLEGVYQKATYLKGTELFNMANYRDAIEYFKKSLKYPADELYRVSANLWIGESYSIGRRYDDAFPYYRNVVGSQGVSDKSLIYQAHYGLGYAYYNTKDYKKALLHFKSYVQPESEGKNRKFYHDAMIRLADCYYVSKEYSQALSYYTKAVSISKTDMDYALYQSGVIEGIQGNLKKALGYFDQVITISRSRYIDDAIFQKGQLNYEQGNYKEAISSFTKLINSKPDSRLIPYSYLKRGSAYYNEKSYDKTVEDYLFILNNYPKHSTAGEILLPLQEVLSLVNRGSEFDSYLAEYKKNNPDKKGLQSVDFETAKSQYYNLSYQKAIDRFKEYITTYPEDSRVDEAKYYMAESYYRLKNYDPALELYNELFSKHDFSYRNKVVARIAEVEYASGRYQNAIYFYRELGDIAATKKEQYNIWSGLMESYFMLGKYDSVKRYANVILEEGNVHISSQNKALTYLGKASFAKGDYKQAEDDFLSALNNARDVYGAESQYMLGQIYYLKKEYKKSIETLIELSKNFAPYTDWVGKGYLLLADDYLALNENFQAKETLKSIVENFPDEFYRKKAANKLKSIEAMEADKEKSIIKSDSLIKSN